MPMRLVLDTNIWLDWLVFNDPGIAPVRESVASGNAEIFITGACEQELERVLTYPLRKAPLPANLQLDCMAQLRRLAHRFDEPALPAGSTGITLPKCKDPDDQKFLVLARDCRADWLLTRDRDLLVFARRKYQYLPFRIITPAQFNGAQTAV